MRNRIILIIILLITIIVCLGIYIHRIPSIQDIEDNYKSLLNDDAIVVIDGKRHYLNEKQNIRLKTIMNSGWFIVNSDHFGANKDVKLIFNKSGKILIYGNACLCLDINRLPMWKINGSIMDKFIYELENN